MIKLIKLIKVIFDIKIECENQILVIILTQLTQVTASPHQKLFDPHKFVTKNMYSVVCKTLCSISEVML
jgi:hypothetical protein